MSMSNSLEVIQAVISNAEKAKQQITNVTELVEQAAQISIGVASAIEQQSLTITEISGSAESLQNQVNDDQKHIEELEVEADTILTTAQKLDSNTSNFA